MQNEKRDLGVIIIEKGKKKGVFTIAQHTYLKKKFYPSRENKLITNLNKFVNK